MAVTAPSTIKPNAQDIRNSRILTIRLCEATSNTGLQTVSFGLSMVLTLLVVFLSVYSACRLGDGWMGKRFNDVVVMASAH